MGNLSSGILLFFVMHLLPFSPIKQILKAKLGEKLYKAIYSLIVLLSVYLMVIGYQQWDADIIWSALPQARIMAIVIMLGAIILIMASQIKSNISRLAKNPMLLGVLLWAIAHLMKNTTQADLMLFGFFAAYSLFAMRFATNKTKKSVTESLPISSDIKVIIAGIVLYIIIFAIHFMI